MKGVLEQAQQGGEKDIKNPSFEVLSSIEESYDELYPAAQKDTEAFVWFTKIPHSRFNVVTHIAGKEIEAKIDEIIQKAPSDLPLSFWVHPLNSYQISNELMQRGFTLFGRFPAMIWQVKNIQPTIQHEVRAAKDMDEFHEILAKTLHYSNTVKKEFQKIMQKDNIENYLVYIDGKPVGTASLWIKGKKGVLMNVMVLPEYQRKGAGRSISQYIMKRASELQLEKVMLRSSPAAEKMYASLGFQKLFDIDIYTRHVKP
jgi:N-acetylglutamate synthase-like GNAT family acetyltransferase